MNPPHRLGTVGAIAVGGSVTVVALLPAFLTSAMAVQMTSELAFGSAGLGLAVASFRAGGAASSLFLGRLADQLGAIRSIRIAALMAGVVGIGIATTAQGLASLVAWLALGGASLAMAQPGANRLLTSVVDPARLGTAFGIKQSAPPGAAMLAGAAVPVVAVTIGWRWAFVMGAVGALVLALRVRVPPRKAPADPGAVRTPRQPLDSPRVIALLGLSFGLGTSTASATTTFYVASAAASGSTPEFAGTMLAVASVAAITARVVAGMLSDRMVRGHLAMCAVLVAIGSVGVVLLATGTPALMAVGVTVALIGNWGFNGVFWFALVRAYPDTPGRITGAVSPGGLLGATLGPIGFGLLVERAGYGASWLTVSVVGVVAVVVLLIGNQRLAAARP